MTDDDFDDRYDLDPDCGFRSENFDDGRFETFGKDYRAILSLHNQCPKRVWSVLPDNDNTSLVIHAGLWKNASVVYYMVTKQEWKNRKEQYRILYVGGPEDSIELEITAEAGIRMLQSDKIDLSEFGKVKVTRASHVEFDNGSQKWFIACAATGELLADGFTSRGDAIKWEKAYFAPSGAGWKKIKK